MQTERNETSSIKELRLRETKKTSQKRGEANKQEWRARGSVDRGASSSNVVFFSERRDAGEPGPTTPIQWRAAGTK